MNLNNNPFNVKIDEIIITKFNGSDRMAITPQVAELVIYQSIFSPIIKAQLVMGDFINLINNYPLTGEETIEIIVKQGKEDTDYGLNTYYAKFVIESVENVTVSTSNRQMVYTINLASEEAFMNAKTLVSHAYNLPIEDVIQDVLTRYLKTTKNYNKFEDTKQFRRLIIPNLRPFAAFNWLCKYAISSEPKKYYTQAFFETLNGGNQNEKFSDLQTPGFTFKSLQKPTFKGLTDSLALNEARKFPYFYLSNIEAVRNNKTVEKNFRSRGFVEDRLIQSVQFNKRYSTLEKIIGGYFENELVEINMNQKDHRIQKTIIDDMQASLHKGRLNTELYSDNIIKEYREAETSPRVRYIVNNFDDLNQPSFRDKFGNSVRNFLALSQIDMSVGILTDLTLRPGDLFYADFPEFQGFNDVPSDKYLSGYFLVSEIKNVIRPSGATSTLLRINKDSYTNSLFEQSLFNTDNGGTNVNSRSRTEIDR